MTSISGTGSPLGSLTSYYAQLVATKATADDDTDTDEVDETATAKTLTSAQIQSLVGSDGSDTLSGLLGSSSGGGSLASLLGSGFTDTNSLLSQISALATGSASADGTTSSDGAAAADGSDTSGATDPSKQQKISSLLASVFQTEQREFLSLFL